jgi:hypothetical protein
MSVEKFKGVTMYEISVSRRAVLRVSEGGRSENEKSFGGEVKRD